MHSTPGTIRREDVVLALAYAGLTWLLHSLGITATGAPAVPSLEPWWPALALAGSAVVVLRRSTTRVMVPVSLLAAVVLLLAGAAGGFFLLFEAVFSLVLFGTAKAAKTAEVAVLLLCAAGGAAAWLAGGSFADGVVALLAGAMVLLLPAEWAGNVRKARELAVSEGARAAAIRGAARDQARLAARDHELELAGARQEMARELHDVLSSRLSAIALQSAAALNTADPALDREVLAHVRRESVAGLRDLNAMIRMLNAGEPRALAGDVGDLDAVIAGHRAAGMDLEWNNTLPGGGEDLPGGTQAAIHRLIAESLVNAGRHAAGASVRASLEEVPSGIRLRVADDGGTEEPQGYTAGTGTGLPSMRARAEQLGGYAIAGPEGHGWRVEAFLPTNGTGTVENEAP